MPRAALRWIATAASSTAGPGFSPSPGSRTATDIVKDLAERSSFCRERGIKSIVGGIQAVGVLAAPVSELGANVVIAGGHQAPFGLAGAGFMYATPEMIETVVPPCAADLSFASPDRALAEFELAHDAHRFEYGNANFLGCWVQRRSAEFRPWEGALTPSQ